MTDTVDLIVTTVGPGQFLEPYGEALAEDGVRLVAIPDRKSPPEFFAACERARGRGATVLSPDIDEQDRLLAKLGVSELVPYDTDNRRNVGFLMSYIDGSPVAVAMDDDNIPVDRPFADQHRVVARGPARHRVVSADNGWFNVCDLLTIEPGPVFPRGFPYRSREVPARLEVSERTVDVRVNAGLWLDEPDVDAITRLALRPRVTGYERETAVLAPDTWCPANSQNTAVHHDALPAYYYLQMGQPIGGARVDRFGDIFSGYFVAACAKHLGHAVRFGGPLVNHERNDHDVFQDLHVELPAIRFMDDLLDWLVGFRPEGSDYVDAYESLSHGLQDFAEQAGGRAYTPEVRAFLHRSAHLMRVWLRAVRTVRGA